MDIDVPNELWDIYWTEVDKISVWNGERNESVGNYKSTVSRPLRSLIVYNGTDYPYDPFVQLIINLETNTDNRKQDRTNGLVLIPDCPNSPAETAALIIGLGAKLNSEIAEGHLTNNFIPEVYPGINKEYRITSDPDVREDLVRHGISPTIVRNGVVYLQNLLTLFRPDDLPIENNGFKSYRNISILQNMMNFVYLVFSSEKWRGISIVADVKKVSDIRSRSKSRDLNSVRSELISIANIWEQRAWIYSADFTIERLKVDSSLISIRSGGNGFSTRLPVLLSGESVVMDNVVQFDVSFDVVL